MKTKYTMFRRGEMFYMQDSATGKQTSLRTKDETEAKSLLEARNAAQRQPVLNLHLARAYLTASDPAFVERTWQTVMEQLQSRGKDTSKERCASVFKSASFDALRQKKLLETTTDDFFAVFKDGKVSIVYFLKRLHNFALSLGWIAIPIVAPYLWPKYEAKDRRGITQDEHQSVLQQEKNAEWKLYLELLWETGASQSDAVNFKAEDVDWQTRTISYFRQKTGSLAQFTISNKLETVLSHLPTTGVLFPKLSTFSQSDRASRFRRRCHKAGVSGVTLHCYRYAWAERAKVVGMPERFAQAALGHNSKAIHRAYAKKAIRNASPVPHLTSLYHFHRAGEYGDRNYPGNCGGKLIRDLLLFFGSQNVFDPMTGSGTCADVCCEMGIPCLSRDIRQGFDATDADCFRSLAKFDFIWAHPPYWRQKLYTPDSRDLSQTPTLATFLERYAAFIANCAGVLSPNGKLAILMGDYCDREAGFVSLTYHTKQLAFAAGLRQCCTDIIRFSHGASSSRKIYRSSFIPGLHDVCMVFEKA